MGATPDELRDEVEARRAHLAHNVDLLADRVAPGRIAHRRADAARRGLTGVKERVMGSVDDTTSTVEDIAGRVGDGTGQLAESAHNAAGQLAEGVQQTPAEIRHRTRGNPLAAGIIAFGAGMLAGTLFPATRVERQAGARLREHADDLTEPIKQAVGQAAQEVKEDLQQPAREAVDSVRTTAQDAAQTTADRSRQAVRHTTDTLKPDEAASG
ncbi:DUF3618 domain-containing protein [Kitasatospora sp. NPDC085895]|uniref:DUF3618 domain-containing protein n=1 Tax=Kitasatospora sp. NPDC085895 TaxID=3155057 RepID=UPI00344FF4A2